MDIVSMMSPIAFLKAIVMMLSVVAPAVAILAVPDSA